MSYSRPNGQGRDGVRVRLSPDLRSTRSASSKDEQLYVPAAESLQRSPSASAADNLGRRPRERSGTSEKSHRGARSRTPTYFYRHPTSDETAAAAKNGAGLNFLSAPLSSMGRSVSWGAIDQIGLSASISNHNPIQAPQPQPPQQLQQQQQQDHLDESEVYRQICKAKAEAKTVSTVNGCLYIDYKYIGQLPPDY